MKRFFVFVLVFSLFLVSVCGCTGGVVSFSSDQETSIRETTNQVTESSSSDDIDTSTPSSTGFIPESSEEPSAQYLQIDYNPYLISPRSIELFGENVNVFCEFYDQYVEDVIDGRPERELPEAIRPLLSKNIGLNVFQRIHPLKALVRESHVNLEDTHVIREFYFDVEEHERRVELIENRVEEIISTTICEDFNQLEATLAIYHYLSMNSSYLEGEFDSTYGILVDSQGVCTGFVGAMRHLLLQAGYDDGYSIHYEPEDSTVLGHVWNMININGEWYHFDITWENSSGSENLLYYFGMTDDERADPSLEYYAMELAEDMPIPKCTDESFKPLREAEDFVFDLENHAVHMKLKTGEWMLWNTQDMTFTVTVTPK